MKRRMQYSVLLLRFKYRDGLCILVPFFFLGSDLHSLSFSPFLCRVVRGRLRGSVLPV